MSAAIRSTFGVMRDAGGDGGFCRDRPVGMERLEFLHRFLPFERGIPSHDALNDVFNALDAELFRSCFTSWVETLRDTDPDLIAIDGKTSRREPTSDRRAASLCVRSTPGPAASAFCWDRRRLPTNPTISIATAIFLKTSHLSLHCCRDGELALLRSPPQTTTPPPVFRRGRFVRPTLPADHITTVSATSEKAGIWSKFM